MTSHANSVDEQIRSPYEPFVLGVPDTVVDISPCTFDVGERQELGNAERMGGPDPGDVEVTRIWRRVVPPRSPARPEKRNDRARAQGAWRFMFGAGSCIVAVGLLFVVTKNHGHERPRAGVVATSSPRRAARKTPTPRMFASTRRKSRPSLLRAVPVSTRDPEVNVAPVLAQADIEPSFVAPPAPQPVAIDEAENEGEVDTDGQPELELTLEELEQRTEAGEYEPVEATFESFRRGG